MNSCLSNRFGSLSNSEGFPGRFRTLWIKCAVWENLSVSDASLECCLPLKLPDGCFFFFKVTFPPKSCYSPLFVLK